MTLLLVVFAVVFAISGMFGWSVFFLVLAFLLRERN